MNTGPAEPQGPFVRWPEMVDYVSGMTSMTASEIDRNRRAIGDHEAWHRNNAERATYASRTWRLTFAMLVATAIGSIAVSITALVAIAGHAN